MGGLTDFLFGGTDDSSQKSQIKSNAAAQKFIEERAAEARRDVLALFPGIQESQLTGIQGAFDVFGQTIPQQVETFQAGNLGAQETLLAGLPQMQNAIMGLPTDLSGLQAQRVPVDLSFSQQQVPDFFQAVPALDEVPEIKSDAQIIAEQKARAPIINGINLSPFNSHGTIMDLLQSGTPEDIAAARQIRANFDASIGR